MMTSNIGDVLKPGKLIEMGKAKVSTGGAAANTGLGMKCVKLCDAISFWVSNTYEVHV